MAKTKKKARTFKVQDCFGTPFLMIKGKYLAKDLGLEAGSQLRMIEGKNMIVLVRVPASEVKHHQNLQQLAVCEQEAAYLRSIIQNEEVSYA